ncbi:MAG TPA: cytochrome c biogenesis protein CcsA [Thermoanaerobaculia bacterium]|nr:cytochrome c biogenesis protein CcsA [Thermoanaerobaculia bacterium]
MKLWIERLASLKLTVVLLLTLGVLLAAGTIVESTRGAAAAQAVYYSPWFLALQALFGLNLLAALVERWPRNRWRIGFALTHASMLLILVGALMTWAFKIEGRLPIWEGESSSLVYRAGDDGDAPYELPFRVRLDSFEIDTYPGTRRPAMFRSRVVVLAGSGAEHPAVIEMNRPLEHAGFNFFQSSYQIQGGREMTILQVSRDPGEAIVFLGYVLLVAGMIVVFFTRLAQHRRLEQMAAAPAAGVALAAAALLLAAAPAGAALVPDAAATANSRAVAVQHDGRAMPFDTQARNAVRDVTRLGAWPGVDPVAMALGWVIDPQGWQAEPIVRVRGDVAAVAGLGAGVRYASFADLVGNRALIERVGEARARAQQEEAPKPPPLDQHLLELESRLVALDGYFRGEDFRPLPAADALGTWGTVQARGAGQLVELGEQLRRQAPAHYPSAAAIARELRYNEVRPTRIAWWLLVPAALAAGFTMARDRFRLRLAADALTVAGFLVATWGIAVRWQIAGRIPASNMFESMLFLGWGVALFGVVSVALRNRLLVFNAAAMAALAALLTDVLPMDPYIHPMPPVLSGTPWLAIHVPIIMVGYAVLAIVMFFGHLVVGVEIFAPRRRDLAERWSQLLYWYTHVGSILLLAGILTGSIWAASSWGRYWGWDPKEVWSLVAFLAYMAILHARFDQQIQSFGVAVGSIAAFWTILMTYLGVNFVLASGLHSYGFGSSSLVRILAAFAAAEIAFLLWGWSAVKKRLAAQAA